VVSPHGLSALGTGALAQRHGARRRNTIQVAAWLFMVAFAYGVGVFWYDLLPGKLPDMAWRVAAYPFVLMVIGEAFVPVGPSFLGFHPATAVVAALVGVIIDWIVTVARHPQAIATLELRSAPAHS
jgi:hypothetical protein